MLKQILISIRLMTVMTLLLGLVYPLAVTFLGQTIFPAQANGGLIIENGRVIGSELIAQKFTQEGFFWSRPSAVDYNPLPSGGSNLSPIAKKLQDNFNQQKKLFGDRADVPQQLLFSSGSGLDPHLSPEAAFYQIPRVARARSMAEEPLRQLVKDMTEGPQWGLMGESRVNVLKLNLALLKLQPERTP